MTQRFLFTTFSALLLLVVLVLVAAMSTTTATGASYGVTLTDYNAPGCKYDHIDSTKSYDSRLCYTFGVDPVRYLCLTNGTASITQVRALTYSDNGNGCDQQPKSNQLFQNHKCYNYGTASYKYVCE